MDAFVHVLGCGDAFSAGGRNNTCFLVNYGGEFILLDCGSTSLPLIRNAGYDLKKIRTIILTHFHGDHFGGVPALILNAMHGDGGKDPITIFSPPYGREKLASLMESMYPGTSSFLDELPVEFHYYSGKPETFSSYSVLGLPVVHTEETIPHGVKITFKDITIAFSGDTSWTPALIELAMQSALFILECNFLNRKSKIHLDYETISQHFSEFRAKKIVLTHMGEEVINKEDIPIDKLFDGRKLRL